MLGNLGFIRHYTSAGKTSEGSKDCGLPSDETRLHLNGFGRRFAVRERADVGLLEERPALLPSHRDPCMWQMPRRKPDPGYTEDENAAAPMGSKLPNANSWATIIRCWHRLP